MVYLVGEPSPKQGARKGTLSLGDLASSLPGQNLRAFLLRTLRAVSKQSCDRWAPRSQGEAFAACRSLEGNEFCNEHEGIRSTPMVSRKQMGVAFSRVPFHCGVAGSPKGELRTKYLDPQTTHKNRISPHNFGGQTHF